jgi:hypothetical protein
VAISTFPGSGGAGFSGLGCKGVGDSDVGVPGMNSLQDRVARTNKDKTRISFLGFIWFPPILDKVGFYARRRNLASADVLGTELVNSVSRPGDKLAAVFRDNSVVML